MADGTQEHNTHQQSSQRNVDTQLEYPRLLIEASFASLLSHSQSSGSRTIGPMPPSYRSLSESWSSLSERDLSHDDDDLHSEPIDTGSLIDVSTADDMHSVDGREENNSDVEERSEDDSEEPGMTLDEHFARRQHTKRQNPVWYTGLHPQDSVSLEDSTVVVDESGVASLQGSRSFTDAQIRSSTMSLDSSSGSDELIGLLMMPISPSRLVLVQQPYHIFYYGSALTSPEIKSDVLGKIGAALISGSDYCKQDDNSESPCYHVIPSEFGPGSKPSIADLIPIPTRMHVSDCTVYENRQESVSAICLCLDSGRQLVSRAARFYEIPSNKSDEWKRPDLTVVVVSQHDSTSDRRKASKVVEFARRHHIPVLALRQEGGWDGDEFLTEISPQMLHKRVWSASQDESSEVDRKMLVDVDTFIALDTQQLNQHLNHITVSIAHTKSQPYQFFGWFTTGFRQGWQQLLSSLANSQLEKTGSSDIHHNEPQSWMVETSTSHTHYASEKAQVNKKSNRSWNFDNVEPTLSILRRTLMFIFWTALTGTLMYSCLSLLPPLTSMKTLPPVPTNIPNHCTKHVSESVSTKPAISTATPTTQTHALSGPFQVLEQQMQSWLPVQKAGVRKQHQKHDAVAVTERKDVEVVKPCINIVPARISPNLKVHDAFFDAGNPAFTVDVRRGIEKIAAKIERQADNSAVIMIKRKDCHGQLTVNIEGFGERVCAALDLENSVHEALTMWVKNLDRQDRKFKTANKIANNYLRLLEVRSARSGLVSTAVELHYSATQGIGAAVEAVEKSAIKHAKICHQQSDECFVRKIGDLMRSVRNAQVKSESLIQTTRDCIADTTTHAKSRAQEATNHAREEVSKAIQVIQSSVRELAPLHKIWPTSMKQKLAEAQGRASKLVKKGSRTKIERRHMKIRGGR